MQCSRKTSRYKELEENYRSPTHYILESLLPYGEANLNLVFKPSRFFADLKKLDHIAAQHTSLRPTYYRAIKTGLISIDSTGIPRLTEKGRAKLQKFQPSKLGGDAKILLVFDIPEAERTKRNKLRTILRELKFEPIQKSVWQTEYNVLGYLRGEIIRNQLEDYTNIYESSLIAA